MEKQISKKQISFIYHKLKEKGEMFEYAQLSKLTMAEAKGIIERNIVEHRPFLKWYIWKYKGKNYVSTTRYYTMLDKFNNIEYKKAGIEFDGTLYLNKRLALEQCDGIAERIPVFEYGRID